MKTAIYVRVSTEEQAREGFSIEAQLDKLKGFVEIKEWELYDIYKDEGISGKNIIDRPDINRLISDVISKKVKNVLVFKIDRITRNTKDLITLMDLFNEHNCAFNSLTESIDTHTASGRMFIKIIGIFAEFERENLIERLSVAFEKKARDGYTNASFTVPYGYAREKGNRIITINEDEAKIVKKIFAMYLDNHKTLNAIATELNMRGIKSSTCVLWKSAAIKYILTNPIYAGKVRYSVYDKTKYFEAKGKHESIIDEATYAKVQSKIAKMQRTVKKRPKEVNYYCGTLKCGVCGSKMTTHEHYLKDLEGNHIYYCAYICSERNKDRSKCQSSAMSHNKVDVAFNEYIANIKDFVIEHDININQDTNTGENTTELKADYEKTLSKLRKKEEGIMKLYIADEINFDEYNKMAILIKADILAYMERISELETEQNVDVRLSPQDIITNLQENWHLLTDAERGQFLQTYIESIYVVNLPINETGTKKAVEIKKVEYNPG